VIGLSETSCHLAMMFGQRFAIMQFIDRMAPLYHEQMRLYGLADLCAGIRASGLGFQDILAGFTDPGPVLPRLQEAVRRIARETAADAVIPGEVPMNLLRAINGINRMDDIPLIDSLACTMKMAELMVDPRRAAGIARSRHGWFNAAPSAERVAQVATLYGMDRLGF
jgi:allantoin racemase